MDGIPKPGDFYSAGRELFDLAWDVVANLLVEHNNFEESGLEPEEFSEDYWKSARRYLSTALAVTQQAVEFVLKGRIAAVSPFLLLADQPSRWPSPYKADQLEFSDFRTIDAQDLVQVHDTFCGERLPGDFVLRVDQLRRDRNRIMHTVADEVTPHVSDVVETILEMFQALFPAESWPAVRLKFIEDKYFVTGIGEYAVNHVSEEFSLIYKLLKPAKLQAYLGVNKRQRLYTCPGCLGNANRDWDFGFKLAVLKPNSPQSTSLYCPICDRNHEIERYSCKNGGCKGNVFSLEGGCLTCPT